MQSVETRHEDKENILSEEFPANHIFFFRTFILNEIKRQRPTPEEKPMQPH